MKPYRVEYVQLEGWEADVEGLWLAENEDWLLLKLVRELSIDGYALVAKHHIESRKPNSARKRTTERILKLKGVTSELPTDFSFADILALLQWIESQFGLFEFQDEEDTTFLGWLRDTDETHFRIDALTTRGKKDRDYDLWFGKEEIQIIKFDSDYANSLKLLWQDEVRKQWKMPNDN